MKHELYVIYHDNKTYDCDLVCLSKWLATSTQSYRVVLKRYRTQRTKNQTIVIESYYVKLRLMIILLFLD